MFHMMRYHIGWVDEKGLDQEGSGKLSRPTLCLLACEAVGGDWHSALPAAAAIELVHNFSLIHDDIQDRSYERRNRPTVWKLWGEAQGINAGDAMYALAHLTLLRLSDRGVAPEKVVLLSKQLNLTSLELCQGQYLDIEYESHMDVGVEHYLDMIGKKTAALFETALYFGAVLGTDNQAHVSSLRSFGRNLGMAYQVYNDLEGIWEKGESGKGSPYTDITHRKKTLPILYAIENAEPGEKETLIGIYNKAEVAGKDLESVLLILDRTDARAYAGQVRDLYHRQGVEELRSASIDSAFRQELEDTAAYLLGGSRCAE